MSRDLAVDRVRTLRMRAQLLCGPRPVRVPDAVARVGAVQAQSIAAARLAVRARTAGLTADDVSRAINDDRAVVRTWAMRGTLHMLAAADVRWMVALLGPIFAAAGRRRRQELHLTDEVCERGLAAIATVLAGSPPLARAELVARIAEQGVRIDPATQAPAHLFGYAAMRGLICRGPELPGPSYVLLDEWLGTPAGPVLDPDTAVAELAGRYLAGHGPATARDFAAWSGLPIGRARTGFGLVAADHTEVSVAGEPAYLPSTVDPDAPAEPVVRLLGQFDEYLLGFGSRDFTLDPAYAKRIQAGGGIITPAVLVDGRVAGTWRVDRKAGSLRVRVEPFTALPRGTNGRLAAEVTDIGRFLGGPATLVSG